LYFFKCSFSMVGTWLRFITGLDRQRPTWYTRGTTMEEKMDKATAVVFVTQYSRNLKFGEAEAYGTVVFLTDQEYKAEPSMPGSNECVTKEIVNGMVSYVAGTDYIVVTGSSMPNVVIGTVLAGKPGPHKILKWSNRDKKYELFILKL